MVSRAEIERLRREAKELESELERQRAVVGELAALPADPVAYLVVYHLDTVERSDSRTIGSCVGRCS